MRRSGEHAVFRRQPALALADEEIRHGRFDATRAKHDRAAETDEDTTRCLPGKPALIGEWAELIGRTILRTGHSTTRGKEFQEIALYESPREPVSTGGRRIVWVNRVPPNDEPTTDEDLLTRIRSGQREWFGLLVRKYERELFGYLRRYLGDAELAADVFQNTFLAVFQKIQQYEPGRPARPWLYTIATHQAIDALRRKARRRDSNHWLPPPEDSGDESAQNLFHVLQAAGPGPVEQAELGESRREVRDAVVQLPELLKQVVLLTYFHGLKYQDAAEILGVPLGTVKSRLHAALAKLSELMNPPPQDGDNEGEGDG